jgi:hypothetical protein
MRLYVSNHSYPELREIESRWEIHRTWWRAARTALRDRRLWAFAAIELMLLVAFIVGGTRAMSLIDARAARFAVGGAIIVAAHVACAGLALTWGGDLMRPHLRRASERARSACPRCGHLQTDRLIASAPDVRCAECGTIAPRSVFEPPFAIPARFLAFRLPFGSRGQESRET